MFVVSICSYKGGVGKTTAAINIAQYLYLSKHRTVLVDGDPNRSALDWAAKGHLGYQVISPESEVATPRPEYLVIDTQARPEGRDMKDLITSDLLVIPTTPQVLAIDGLLKTIDQLPAEARYRVLMSMAPPRPQRDGEEALDDLRQAGIAVFDTAIPLLKAVEWAADAGRPLSAFGTRNARRVWRAFFEVGQEIERVIHG